MKTVFARARCVKLLLALALGVAGATTQAADFTVAATFPTFTINGAGNPGLTLRRGTTYTFSGSNSTHPFYIKSIQTNTTANAYNTGVTGNGMTGGTLTFAVPTNAPGTLFYNCANHSQMTGTITVIDPPVPPAPRILKLTVGTNLDLKFTGSNTFSYFPEFNTNRTTTNWFLLTVPTNVAANGTNDAFCTKPSGSAVFIRVRVQ